MIFDACDCLENQRIKYATRLLKDEAILTQTQHLFNQTVTQVNPHFYKFHLSNKACKNIFIIPVIQVIPKISYTSILLNPLDKHTR